MSYDKVLPSGQVGVVILYIFLRYVTYEGEQQLSYDKVSPSGQVGVVPSVQVGVLES